MIINNRCPNEKLIDLDELLARLASSKTINHIARGIYDEEEIQEVGKWLASYAANRDEIIKIIATELGFLSGFQIKNELQAPTFIIHSDERITLRLVIWLPLSGHFGKTPFSYEELHDHNFDFWTVNVFGDGYRTRMYDYDYNKVTGLSDEVVTLNCRGDQVLSPDKIMFYTRSKDAHVQYPPDEVSVSLNLIVQPDKPPRQYEFECSTYQLRQQQGEIEVKIKKGRFERYTLQESLFHGLINFGNDRSRHLILDVAQYNKKDEIRAIAFEAVFKGAKKLNNKEYVNSITALVAEDPSSYVKTRVANIIKTLNSLDNTVTPS